MGLWRIFKTWEVKPMEMRIRLEEDDFRALVAGREVSKPGARLVLADIGWQRMLEHIGAAMRGEKEDYGLPK